MILLILTIKQPTVLSQDTFQLRRLNSTFGKSAVFHCLMAASVWQAGLVGPAGERGILSYSTGLSKSLHSSSQQVVHFSSEKINKLAFGFPL